MLFLLTGKIEPPLFTISCKRRKHENEENYAYNGDTVRQKMAHDLHNKYVTGCNLPLVDAFVSVQHASVTSCKRSHGYRIQIPHLAAMEARLKITTKVLVAETKFENMLRTLFYPCHRSKAGSDIIGVLRLVQI